jgi:hypothetical protein
MTPLKFKKPVTFEKWATYSVCLRGARKYPSFEDVDLSLYTPNSDEPILANVVSDKQFRFCDLKQKHVDDNYDKNARSLDGIKEAMHNVYIDFEETEIVTILRFNVI